MNIPKHHRSRRRQARAGVSWTVWIKAGPHRVRHHTVDISAHGAKLRPRTQLQPGTPVQLHMVPPEGRALQISPPFVITEDEVDELVRIARRAVDEVAAELQREA